MTTAGPLATDAHGVRTTLSPIGDEATRNPSAVSWGAIIAGAAGAAALSLILLLLGTGLGLSSVSPWSGRGVSATGIGTSTILWLTLTQLAASGMGGYLAGRLRTKWVAVHSDEVYFRDTAHGFLAWAVATLVTAATLTSAVASVLGSGVQAGATVAASAATTGVAGTTALASTMPSGSTSPQGDGQTGVGYYVDSLFRRDTPSNTAAAGDATSAASTSEVTRIVLNDLRDGAMSPEDTRYVGQLVAQRTGLPQAEAEKRATDIFAKIQAKLKAAETAARDAADKARKASAYAALWLFVSLLVGAFVASWAATSGGRRRDL